jgi:hypothetical protein
VYGNVHVKPCLIPLKRVMHLPASVRGPVESLLFRLLAAI